MSKHKKHIKEFDAKDVITCLVFMTVGLFVAGAGFGGCVVCFIVQGCSWRIVLPSLIVVFVGAITFMLSMFTLVEGLGSVNGDI